MISTPPDRIKAIIMDYETTIYNKVITAIAKERDRDAVEDQEMRNLVRWMQQTHEGMRAWYARSLRDRAEAPPSRTKAP